MTKDGLLTYEEEYVGKRLRKYYTLSPRGNTEKIQSINELKDFMETLNKIISPQPMRSVIFCAKRKKHVAIKKDLS